MIDVLGFGADPSTPDDARLSAALAVLDDACDGRSIRLDIDAVGVADPRGGTHRNGLARGVPGMRMRWSPLAGGATPLEVDVVYSEQVYDWLRALALRVRAARSWDPGGWCQAALADVLGGGGSALERAQVPDLPSAERRQIGGGS